MVSTKINDSFAQPIEQSKSTKNKRIIQIIVDLILIIIILVIFGCVYLLVPPKIRYFSCDESDIFYPYIADTIPFWAVGVFGAAGPVLFIILVELFNTLKDKNNEKKTRKYFICLFHALSLFILGIAITLLLTEIGKRWIGR